MRNIIISFLLLCLFITCTSYAQETLTLEKSIQIALQKSPTMLKVRAEIEAAEGLAGQAVAGFLPQLALSGRVGKYYSEPQTVEMTISGTPSVFSFGTDEQADLTSYSASLTQAIFTGGKLTNSLAMANKGLDFAKQELRRVSEEVKFNVINAYYGVSKAKKFVELSEQSVKMAKNHLERIQTLLQHGMSTRADVLRAEVQVAQAEVVFTKAKQALEIAKNSFNNSLGLDLDTPVELTQMDYDLKNVRLYDYKELLKIAYEDRPDWKQYVLVKEVSKAEVGMAYSGLWPMISLVGNYDIGSTKYSSYQSDSKTWTALLSGTWNIFDGTATWNKIKEAQAKLKAQQADEINVKRGIALEVKDANFALKSAKENISGTSKALELAEENYNIAGERYSAGVGTNLEVIDAQVAVTQARTEQLQAQHDLQIAKARINKVVGRKIY
ncbi:MAG: TolC family protein [Candidatus Margulisiibacteriota bacterium]